jgi:hypothetical protein
MPKAFYGAMEIVVSKLSPIGPYGLTSHLVARIVMPRPGANFPYRTDQSIASFIRYT